MMAGQNSVNNLGTHCSFTDAFGLVDELFYSRDQSTS